MISCFRTMHKKATQFLFVPPLAFSVFVVADTATAQPTPVDLGTLGGPTSTAVAVNARGEVVGNSDTIAGRLDPFVWTRDRGLMSLDSLGAYARAVNASGQVVGEAWMADGGIRAFSWTPVAGMTDLGALGGTRSLAWSVNANGQVVGNAYSDDGLERAFSWSAAGGMIDLGTLGGGWASAISALTDSGRTLNNSGQVVGSSATANGAPHAFMWTAARGMIDLGTLRGGYSYAASLNELGQVVGFSDGHAFVWSASSGMIDLGTLGGATSYATGINDNGQVIGQSQTPTGENHAFSWTSDRGLVDLGTLGGDMSIATAVNVSGVVVGYSDLGRGDGSAHAFSWTDAGGVVDLGTLGGRDSFALAINDRGDIVGGSHIPGHMLHATLWPTADTAPPELTIAVQGSGKIWPNNGKMVPVTFTGTVTDASGISAMTFSVSDEYGAVQPSGRVALSDGRFSITVRLEASRRGSDRDGRRYVMRVSATDTAGNSSSRTTAVTVPHDSGK